MRSFLHVFGMIVHSLRKGDGSEEKEEKTKRDRERETCLEDGRWSLIYLIHVQGKE